MENAIIRSALDTTTTMDIYIPREKTSDKAIVIFPGGAYYHRTEHEGKAYAEFLNENGYLCFVVNYAVTSEKQFDFPTPLLDARAAIRYVRHNAQKFGVAKNQIYVMGSSAGGHLAALCSTCREIFKDEDKELYFEEDFLPNGQILAYPVIKLYGKYSHISSAKGLLGKLYSKENCKKYSPDVTAKKGTPKAFVFHTSEDGAVDFNNSLIYCSKLKKIGTPVELHVYPFGKHGSGLAGHIERTRNWTDALLKWLSEM